MPSFHRQGHLFSMPQFSRCRETIVLCVIQWMCKAKQHKDLINYINESYIDFHQIAGKHMLLLLSSFRSHPKHNFQIMTCLGMESIYYTKKCDLICIVVLFTAMCTLFI